MSERKAFGMVCAMTAGNRIRELRKALDLTQEAFTDRLNASLPKEERVTRGAVGNWERGQGIKRRNMETMATAFGVSFEWLATGRGQMVPDGSSPAIMPIQEASSARMAADAENLVLGAKDVPIMGVTVGGQDGEFYMNGEVVDYARRWPGISKNKNVFGVYVEGDSMIPKYEPGELVYASPGRSASAGDYVIIELAPDPSERSGPAFVKRLVRRTGTRILCQQFNPAKEVEYDTRQIKAMYRIIPMAELSGF